MNAKAQTAEQGSETHGGAQDDLHEVLKNDDRARGYLAWQLIGDWKLWVRRRVESITYETSTSIRRRVSVDLRLIPELFNTAALEWGDERVHYVPIALLRKRRLVSFDLRDEQGQAIPLITMSRNAKITAAVLSAAAQSIAIDRWNPPEQDNVTPDLLEIPRDLEGAFLALAYLNPRDSERGEGALNIYRRLTATAIKKAKPIDKWSWEQDGDGRWHADANVDDWRALLRSDDNFLRLAWDVTRLFMVCVPLTYEPGRRRIVKFSYTEYLSQAVEGSERLASLSTSRKLARSWNRAGDRLEGLPLDRPPRPDEWVPALDDTRPTRMSLGRKIGQVIGWSTQIGMVETPAVSHGSSYHISVSTPNGIQIRAAALVTSKPRDHEIKTDEAPRASLESSGAERTKDEAAGAQDVRPRQAPEEDDTTKPDTDAKSRQTLTAGVNPQETPIDRPGLDEPGNDEPVVRLQRGNRNLRAVDLHVADPRPYQTAKTFLYIRPESSLIVRGGFCCSALTAIALTLLWLSASRVTSDSGTHTEAVAAALIVIPGLLTVLAARDTEHPLATSMVFGVRTLAMAPGVLAVVAAGQVIAGDPGSWFGVLLFVLAWVIAGVLGVAWRLSARGQPNPTGLWDRSTHADAIHVASSGR